MKRLWTALAFCMAVPVLVVGLIQLNAASMLPLLKSAPTSIILFAAILLPLVASGCILYRIVSRETNQL